MPGVPAAYTWASADFVDFYDERSQCLLAIWLPADWESHEEISLLLSTYGGGWTSSDHHSKRWSDPTGYALPVSSLADTLLAAGWAVGFVHWPSGYSTTTAGSWPQIYPVDSFPENLARMAKAVQMAKTWGYQGRITNSTAHRTTWRTERVVCQGISSGSDNWAWSLLQLPGAFPYESPDRLGYRRDHPMVPYFDHRAGAAILVDVFSDLRLAADAGLSANLLPLYGANQWHDASPKLQQVSPDVRRASSFLPYVEADLYPNRGLPLFIVNGGSAADGIMLGSAATTKAQFLAAAAARVSIPTCLDPHEPGTALLVEEALKAQLGLAGYRDSLHRIYWGNPTNNPDGRPATPILATSGQLMLDWIDDDLQIPAYT